MYIPKQSGLNLHEQKQKPRRRRTNHRRSVYSMGGALLLLAVLLVIATQQHRNANVAGATKSDKLEHDFEQLWSWSDHVLQGGAQQSAWTMRWDVSNLSRDKHEALAGALFLDSKGQPLDKLSMNDGATIISETGSGFGMEGNMTLQVTEKTEEGVSLFILLESKEDGSVSEQSLEQLSMRISSMLEEIAPSFNAKIKVHGFAADGEAAQEIKRLSLGQELERYDDEGTLSLTLYSTKILSSQQLDYGRKANLQIAAHDFTENDLTEITLGVPLISGDFSDVHQTEITDGGP